jgi:hypothetical protein
MVRNCAPENSEMGLLTFIADKIEIPGSAPVGCPGMTAGGDTACRAG